MVTHENVNLLSKKTYQSKTMWGGIITIAILAASMAGYDIAPDVVDGMLTNILAVASAVYTLYGRKVAKKTLD